MPRKAVDVDENGRGSCCSLEAVKQFLQSVTIPEGYSKNDKRALRRRAKSFVLIGEDLFFTGGRSRHNKGLIGKEADETENPENEPDHTQVLRKVVFSEEEQQDIVNKAHVGEDASHHGMEKTTEQVSNHYYWMRIIHCVRTTIRNCPSCNTRIKNPPCLLPPLPAGHETTTPSVTIHIGAANTSMSKSGEIQNMSEEEIVGGSGQVADDIEVSMGEDGFTVLSVTTDSYSVKQEVEAGTTGDVFSQFAGVTKEVCSHFWQKVEIQILGPYQAGKKQVYVAVALDSYSQFPEAVTMEVLSSATLTNFFLNLFCRYGTVEKVLLLQNEVTRNKDLYVNLQDLLQAGISPSLLFPQVNPLDERWNHIEKSLVRFISVYPDWWFHCLEAFMVPLRITLPPEAVYSPYYLVHGRDAPVPDKLSQVYTSMNSSGHTEVQLTEEQERQTVDMVTAAYGIHTDNPSFPVSLPEPSEVKISCEVICKKENTPTDSAPESQQQQEEQAYGSVDSRSGVSAKRRCGRPRLRHRLRREKEMESMEEKREVFEKQMKEGTDPTEFLYEVGMVAGDDSDEDLTYEPEVKSLKKSHVAQPTRSSGRQRKATYKAQAAELFTPKSTKLDSKRRPPVFPEKKALPSRAAKISDLCQNLVPESSKNGGKMKKRKTLEDAGNSLPPKKKRGRPCKKVSNDAVETTDFTKMMKLGNKKVPPELQPSMIKNMQQLPLDTFYFIIKQYIEHSVFPPGMSDDARQSIVHFCSMFLVKDGRLYSNVGKSAGRLIITGERTRFSLLRKAHARGEVHHGRASVLKYLSDLNVFWNGMSLDVDAFIHCCPECIHHNPLGSLSSVTIPSKSPSLTAQGRKEEEPHMSEDEEEESRYEDLIQYLTDTTLTPTLTPHQQQRIQERSQSFRIIQGSLHYQTHTMKDPRQVLFSDRLKQSAIQEAHVENGVHLSPEDSGARLRVQYLWYGMTADVVQHVMACSCMKQSLNKAPVPHRNPVIQDRVHRMRSYYTDAIPKLDTSAITASEMTAASHHPEESELTLQRQEENEDPPSRVHTGDCGGAVEKPFSAAGEVERSRGSSSVDKQVVMVVEGIIEDIGKSLSGEAKTAEISEGKLAEQSPFGGSVRSRKDAHKCQYCGKFVSGNVAYRIHLYKHTGVKPFNCSTCGKSFTTSKSLCIHTRKHTGVKPYLCNQCGREFFRGTSFKYHLKTHSRTQSKPLPCDECNREFLTQNRLDKHKQYKHPAQPKVYMCEHCGKTFMHARSLKIHEQSHTVKYTCLVCKKEFSQSDELDSHRKEAHADQPKPGEKKSVKSSTLPQSQEHLQQQLLPHILYTTPQTQLVQTIDLSTGNISEIEWREEEHQQAPQHIIITATERPSTPFTIRDHAGNVVEHISFSKQSDEGVTMNSHAGGDHITISEHAGNIVEHISFGKPSDDGGGGITNSTIDTSRAGGDHITISEHAAGSVVEHISFGKQNSESITMNRPHHMVDHITISEHAGTQIRITENPGPNMTLVEHPESREMKSDLDPYSTHTHTPSFSHQPAHTTTTTHILTQIQLPLSTATPSQVLPLQQDPASSSSPKQLQTLHPLQNPSSSSPQQLQTLHPLQNPSSSSPQQLQMLHPLQNPSSSSPQQLQTLHPLQNPSSSSPQQLQTLHPLQLAASSVSAGTEAVLLQQESVPVQYEVECLQDHTSLTEADLNAVHLLAQASLAGQNVALRHADQF